MKNTDRKLTKLWDEAYTETRPHVLEHHLNHAYLEGHQWMDWDPVDLQVHGLMEDMDRLQPVMNRMRANMRTLTSQLTQRHLVFENFPTSYDDATIRAAQIGETIITDLAGRHDWEILREQHIKATMKGGTGIIAVDWSVANNTTVETVLGISEFVVEPGARDPERARWWMKLQLLPPRTVQAMWPKRYEDAPPPADGRTGMATVFQVNDKEPADLVRVLTYYERPNPLQPDGQVLVEVGGEIVETAPWSFPWKDRLNFASAKESTIESETYGSTILSDVRSPQTALNAAWAGALEHLRESSTHRLVFDQSWADQVETLTDVAGSVLMGRLEKGAPSYLTAPPLPSGTLDMISLLQMEIDNLMGVHDVSRGQAPTNIESGLGLSILAEKDSSPVGRLIKETARVWSRVAWMVLSLHEAMVKDKRTTTINDGSGPVRREWKGKDIMGQVDIIVPLEAIIPKSQAAQQAFADNAVQMGLISPEDPLAVMRYAKLADMPDQRGIINAVLPDASKAIRENEAVVMDEVPIPREFDDHQIHIQIHNEFRKSLQYELLTKEQAADIDNHIVAHEQFALGAMGEQALGENIDPRLAAAPRADGAPALPELAQEGVAGPPPQDVPEPVSPDQLADDMASAVEAL